MLVVINPAGPVHIVFNISDIPSTGLNSTEQVRVTLDPTGRMGLGLLLVTVTEDGAGTGEKKEGMENLYLILTVQRTRLQHHIKTSLSENPICLWNVHYT